jgi:hypothetical protein
MNYGVMRCGMAWHGINGHKIVPFTKAMFFSFYSANNLYFFNLKNVPTQQSLGRQSK